MDRNFARALTLVLKSEGGWSDNPADPGGATMKGVTLATFRAYIKPAGTKADLKIITDAQIATVYRRQFWDAVHGSELPGGVDYAAFDFAVNSGPKRAAEYLQRVAGATVDGRLGPDSLKAISAKPAGVIIDAYCDARLAFMRRAKNKKTGKLLWPTFGKGWTARMAAVRRDAMLISSLPAAPPPIRVPVEVPKPVVPEKVEQKVKEKSGFLSWLTGLFGSGALGLGWLAGIDWKAVLAGGGVLIVFILILLLLRSQIVAAVRQIKEEVAE
ncbi:glycosyl hydrolase 108 family protein [Mesorhizobium sp. M0847]|uniref:glycoside hydrolase family 108 protein n=1 Tax=unclassified Mesorhizobium TaxID=325217 RepID=UPI003335E359